MTEQLDALVAAWAGAEAQADRDALDAMLTDDFVGIGPVGSMLPKPVWLTRFALGLPTKTCTSKKCLAGIQYSFMAAMPS